MAAPEDVEHAVELRQRKSRIDRAPSIATRPFAGRIGGNQEFTVSPDDSDFQSVVTKQPDAAASFTWSESLSIGGFADVDLWKQATIEGVGTCLQTYLGGFYAIGLTPVITETSLGPITPAIFGALANVLLISLFIFSAGPVSGGHLNPMISMATFTAKLSAFPRTLLYIIFQCAGAVVAGFLVRASLGAPSASFRVAPGCYIDPALVTPGQAYAMETMVSFAIIFIAFGVGLDPRQKEVFGPALSPILIGLAQGLCTFASSIAKAGYAGASLNPARCLGLMAAADNFEYHYVHWFGGMTAAVLNGIMYWAIPIYNQ